MVESDTLSQPLVEPTPAEIWVEWIEELKTPNPARRLRAARTLCESGSAVVPQLVAALDTATPEHREAILSTLGLLGWRARAAIPAVEKLCDDEQLGPTARETLKRLRTWFQLDRDRLLVAAMATAVVVMVLLTLVKEVGEWLEVWGKLQGPGRAIALTWGLLGGVAGFVLGANLGRKGLAWMGAKALGVLGVAAGAMLGRHVGELLTPLLTALGQ